MAAPRNGSPLKNYFYPLDFTEPFRVFIPLKATVSLSFQDVTGALWLRRKESLLCSVERPVRII